MSIIHNIAITFIKNVGHVTAKNLLIRFGTAEAVFNADKAQLMEVQGIGALTASQILNKEAFRDAEKQMKFIEQQNVKVLFFTDDDYPNRLRNCFDAPILLYYKGNADLNRQRVISVVGSRNATEYGRQLCRQLAEVLAPYEVTIVSGLAYGIDIAAHRESLLCNIPTIGVLAHGLDRIYPSSHYGVAQKMVLNGGLLTEFPLFTSPEKENFPKRNRIIAGLSDVTIVVEANIKGGALITADIAGSYNRDVYAFPGRTTDVSSEGCNFLIKTNKAGLISHAKDLIYYLDWEERLPLDTNLQAELPLGLSEEEQRIVAILGTSQVSVDELSIRSEFSQSKLALHLLNLEMQGILTALPGKVYKLN